MKKKQDYRVL